MLVTEEMCYGSLGVGAAVVASGFCHRAYYPRVTIEQIKANTGWDLKIADDVRETERSSPELIKILREEVDPAGVFLKKQ